MSGKDELNLEEVVVKYPDVPRYIILKLDLRIRGVKLTERALDAIQDSIYSFGPTIIFHFYGDKISKKAYPGPLLLRDGTTVPVSFEIEYDNPYKVDYIEGKFFLYDNDRKIDEVDFTPRPDYYGKKTSRGVPMESIATARAQRLVICAYRHCHFWDTGDQCRYCAFFTDLKEQRQVSNKNFKKDVGPEDIYETVREVLKEPGRISEIYLTAGADYSGNPPYENEVNRYIKILQAIGKNFKSKFSSQIMAPAYTKEQVKKIYDETGLTSYCPNIEVWDERLFKWICPGKEKWLGRDYWINSALDAVEIFGKGNVYTQIIGGVEMAKPYGFKTMDEALKSNFEGCEFFAKRGVVFLSVVWGPQKSSAFAGQKPPPLEYYVRLAKGLHDIRKAYGLSSDNDDYKHCGNHADSDLERID